MEFTGKLQKIIREFPLNCTGFPFIAGPLVHVEGVVHTNYMCIANMLEQGVHNYPNLCMDFEILGVACMI